MKFKVINVINHPPPYEGHRGRPRPKVHWDLPNGDWVGIWGYDWHNLIGDHVLAISNDLEYEVWQPDLKADKIYQHTFDSGVTHKLFPAIDKKFVHGLHIVTDIYAQLIMDQLEMEYQSGKKILLHLNAGYRYINIPILEKYTEKIPIVGQFYTNSINIFKITKSWNPLKKINAYKKYFELKRYYKKIKFIIPSVSEGAEYFEKEFGAKVFYRDFANFGRDFSDWSRKKTTLEAKNELGIPSDKFVILSSSRLIPIKQIDKLIEALAKVEYQHYICYISGRGTVEYEKYLFQLVDKYHLTDKVKFIGYVDFDDLYNYYQASDLVISTSYQDAGPAPVSNAAAMGVPTLLTATGIGYEFYKQYNVGIVVPIDDYKLWTTEINNVMNGKKVPVPTLEDVRNFGDWGIISQYYYDVYKTVIKA